MPKKNSKRINIEKGEILESLSVLLNGDFSSFKFDDRFFEESFSNFESMEEFQKSISRIHEISTEQKKNGVFYTPADVCDYIVSNSVLNLYNKSTKEYVSYDKVVNLLVKEDFASDFIFNKTVLDPTSGTGEFLVSVFKLKLKLLSLVKKDYTDDDIALILRTIYGNDIDSEANNITKIRLFLFATHFAGHSNPIFAESLKENVSSFDFLNVTSNDLSSFDLIVGNPPYVERTRVSKYGNIYADILENASNFLKENGVLGFIIPLSYVSTPRMVNIREIIEKRFEKQLITNYADRPASLFTRVHQKLSIVIAVKKSDNKSVYVSNYKYFYKDERKQLLSGSALAELDNRYDFYPKVSNETELSTLRKLYTESSDNLFDCLNITSGSTKLYLNMRGYFWNKAFSFSPGSSEYKEFHCKPELFGYLLCLLNSSVFWYFWVLTSDCWHITRKELKSFKVVMNKNIDLKNFDSLAKKLEDKLEQTKEYIGTVQAEYAYKHKYCKDVIDEIDDSLALLYGLDESEIKLIKNYGLQYRVGRDDE